MRKKPEAGRARRRVETPGPDEFGERFPFFFLNKDDFKRFKLEWRRLETQKGVNCTAVLDTLTGAWYHAKADEAFHNTLTRLRDSGKRSAVPSFFEQDRRIRKLLKALFDELQQLLNQDPILGGPGELESLLLLHLSRALPGEELPARAFNWEPWKPADDDHMAEEDAKLLADLEIWYGGNWTMKRGVLLPPPHSLRTSLKPIMELYFQFASYLMTLLYEIGGVLRRDRGHQSQAWLHQAVQDLRKAGLTKDEADTLLRIMGLKGSEAAEAARQTTSRR